MQVFYYFISSIDSNFIRDLIWSTCLIAFQLFNCFPYFLLGYWCIYFVHFITSVFLICLDTVSWTSLIHSSIHSSGSLVKLIINEWAPLFAIQPGFRLLTPQAALRLLIKSRNLLNALFACRM